MEPIGCHNYYVYILTNKNKTVLYTGVTRNIKNRLQEHCSKINKKSFTSKYNVFYLLYYEKFEEINHAIQREKEVKGWTRLKKENLITAFNPDWLFLNDTEI